MDIRVYRISTCHWCDKVESFLEKHEIHYRSIVVDLLAGDEQEKAVGEAYRLSRQRSFPVTYVNGTCVIGFHESRLRNLLNLPIQEEKQKDSISEDGGNKGCSLLEDGNHRELIEKMRGWLHREAETYSYKINPDQRLIDDLLRGLVINEKRYGYKVCPCRLAAGKYQMDCDIICPCSYCFSDVEKYGKCYCSLFVSDRFISGDPSLPQYVPDSRERSEVRGETVRNVPGETLVTKAEAAAFVCKIHTKVIGFIQDSTEKHIAKEGFLKIMKSLGLDASTAQWFEGSVSASTIIHDTKLTVRLREDADVYTYQITCMAVNGKPIQGETLFQSIDLTEHKNKLFECSIIMLNGIDMTEGMQLFLPQKRYLSSIYNRYHIAAGFEVEGASKDTFLLRLEDDMFEKIMEDIVMLEISYYLLRIERQRYILADDKLDMLESTIVAKMGIISMNLPKSQPEVLKEWLHGLSNNFSEISGIAEESRHRMNYTILKRDTIRGIFKDWGENNNGFHYAVLSRFFLERVDNLGDQYQHLFLRINGIRREMADLIAMLRTKIDLIVQEQSLELQRSMDETTKTQVMMQHTVEGLSVIVLSYYTIHLAGFIFESLEASHIIHVSLTTAKAIFVPIAIALSWFLTFRARRLIKRHGRSKRK